MDPRAFLDLAKNLSKQSNDEAALRTSVSRSYFALHNFLSQFMEDNGFTLPATAKKHELVRQNLNNCGFDNIKLIAKHLDELRDERNDADYELKLDKFQNPNHTNLLFIKARTAYDDFQKFTGDSNNRRGVVKGISEYRKRIHSI